jgi:cell shape-determining protein MreC
LGERQWARRDRLKNKNMLYFTHMETIMKADIFFFISSIASVVLTILLSIVLFYFIKAGKILYLISKKLEDHFQESEEFVLELKERLEDNLIFRLFFPPARYKRRETKKEKEEKKIANN